MFESKNQSENTSEGRESIPGDSMCWQYRCVLASVLVALGLLAIAFMGPNFLVAWGMLVLLIGFVWTGHTGWAFAFVGLSVAQHCIFKLNLEAANARNMDLAIVVGVLAFLSTSFRYSEMVRYAFAFNVDSQYKNVQRFGSRNAQLVLRTLFRSQWYLGPLALAAAVLLLAKFPSDESYLYDYWLQPKPGRWIMLTFVLFFVWYVSRMMLSVIHWLLLKPEVADIAIRSHFAREIWQDWAAIERRRAKCKTRRRQSR